MAVSTALPPIFRSSSSLPRGPHDLSRDEVAAIQRSRMLDAVVQVVAEKGYSSATISEITRRAGISPNVFYEHFAGKQACYLSAYQLFAQTLLERIAGEIAPTTEWQDFIAAALGAYLGTLEAEPTAARAFLLEMDGAGPQAREQRHSAYAAIAGAIQQRHMELCRGEANLSLLPDRAYMGIVHGVRELVCDTLDGRSKGRLTDLAPDIESWISATFRGASAPVEERTQPATTK